MFSSSLSTFSFSLSIFPILTKMVSLVSQDNNVVALVSRTGRELQRYRKGRRQVVGFVSCF